MKKIFMAMIVMFGMVFAASAQSPIIQLGKAIGELAVAPVGIAVGVVEGVADGVCDGVTYLVTGQSSSTTTTVTQTTYTQSSPPVYVIPSQPKEKHTVNITNSENVSVNITEVNSSTTTTRTPTVIYVPSTRPTYYYYNPYQFRFP